MKYRPPTGLHASMYMDSMKSKATTSRRKASVKGLQKSKTMIAKIGKKKK